MTGPAKKSKLPNRGSKSAKSKPAKKSKSAKKSRPVKKSETAKKGEPAKNSGTAEETAPKGAGRRLYERIADRKRVPRRWWYPVYPAPPRPEELAEGASEKEKERSKREWEGLINAHAETSKTLRKTVFALLAFAFFCVFTLLGTPDRDLIAAGAKLPVPIPLVSRYDMSFVGFLIVGPLVLLGITLYLQVFLQHLRTLEAVAPESRLPYLFNLPHRSSRALAHVLFYWLTPATLAVFSWKTLPLQDLGPLFFYLFLAAVASSLWVQIRRRPDKNRRWNLVFWALLLAVLVGAASFGQLRRLREMDLVQADLRGLDLRGRILSGANLTEAKLCGANLSQALLDSAKLNRAKLSAGERWNPEQEREVDCPAAILVGASLQRASLDGAKLAEADLREADLEAASLQDADLTGTQLADANLDRAFLDGVESLSQEQLDALACNSFPMSLPAGLKRPFPCDRGWSWKTVAEPPTPAQDNELNPRIFIEGGRFLMGSPEGVGFDNERPQHLVELDSFCIQQHEVTFAEYARFDPSHLSPNLGPLEVADEPLDHPVSGVDWWQAMAYAVWVGGRLPTEAEWEYAARSRGENLAYPWGDDTADCTRAVIRDASGAGCGRDSTWPVCSKAEGNSEQGLCDMSGNVWEWVQDWYGPYSPENQRNPSGPTSTGWRVIRGGSFSSDAGFERSAFRNTFEPGPRGDDLGFRVVLPAPCGELAVDPGS